MTVTLLLSILCLQFSFSHPESTSVVVSNLLEERSITAVHLVLPSARELVTVPMDVPVLPGESSELLFPWGYILNRLLLELTQ